MWMYYRAGGLCSERLERLVQLQCTLWHWHEGKTSQRRRPSSEWWATMQRSSHRKGRLRGYQVYTAAGTQWLAGRYQRYS